MKLKTALFFTVGIMFTVRVLFALLLLTVQYEVDTQAYRYALTFIGLGVIVFAIKRVIDFLRFLYNK